MDVWQMTDAERRQLADTLAGLEEADWTRDSLAAGWSVRDVVAHLTAIGTMSAGKFLSGMVKYGFKFANLQAAGIKANSEGKTPTEMLDAFRATIGSRRKPPGPSTTVLGEVLVHGEDIARALGDAFMQHPPEHVVTVASFYKRNGFPLKVKSRIAGVTLRMTDADWSYGSGPEVSGPGVSILMAMVGRKAALPDLSGEGIAILAGRT